MEDAVRALLRSSELFKVALETSSARTSTGDFGSAQGIVGEDGDPGSTRILAVVTHGDNGQSYEEGRYVFVINSKPNSRGQSILDVSWTRF